MRVLICGGRDFADLSTKIKGSPEWREAMDEYAFGIDELNRLFDGVENITVICGKARGADTMGEDWADIHFYPVDRYPISKQDWLDFGKRAGPRRNGIMLDKGKPDIVVAFPGGNGTADMVRKAKAAEVEVREIKYVQSKRG